MAPKPNPDRDERVSVDLDPTEFVRAMLAVDPDAAPKLTEDEVDELTRVPKDDNRG